MINFRFQKVLVSCLIFSTIFLTVPVRALASDALESSINNMGGASAVVNAAVGVLEKKIAALLAEITSNNGLMAVYRQTMADASAEMSVIVGKIEALKNTPIPTTPYTVWSDEWHKLKAAETELRNQYFAQKQAYDSARAQHTNLVGRNKNLKTDLNTMIGNKRALITSAGTKTVQAATTVSKLKNLFGRLLAPALRWGSRVFVAGTALTVNDKLMAGDTQGATAETSRFLLSISPVGSVSAITSTLTAACTPEQEQIFLDEYYRMNAVFHASIKAHYQGRFSLVDSWRKGAYVGKYVAGPGVASELYNYKGTSGDPGANLQDEIDACAK